MVDAMKLVLAGVTPYASAKRLGLAVETMYRSRLYKLWLHGNIVELRKEITEYRPSSYSSKTIKKSTEENLDR